MSCRQCGSFNSNPWSPSFWSRAMLVRQMVESLEVEASSSLESWRKSRASAVTGPEWRERTEIKKAEPSLLTLHTLVKVDIEFKLFCSYKLMKGNLVMLVFVSCFLLYVVVILQ